LLFAVDGRFLNMNPYARLLCFVAIALPAFPQHQGDTPPPLVWDKLKGTCPASLDWSGLRGNSVVVSIEDDPVLPESIPAWNALIGKFKGEPVVFLEVVSGPDFVLDQALQKKTYDGCILVDRARRNLENFSLPYPRNLIVDRFGEIAGYSSSADESMIRALLHGEGDPRITATPPTPKPYDPTFGFDAAPSYEVHIARADARGPRSLGQIADSRYVARNQPLKLIIADLWDTPFARIVFPDNLDNASYDVSAYVPVENREVVLDLVRQALETKFGLHIEKNVQDQRVYVLTAGPTISAQIQASREGEDIMTGADIALSLEGVLDAPVIDKTGWTGRYNYTASSSVSGSEAAFEIARQLGFELTAASQPIEMLVVRKIY